MSPPVATAVGLALLLGVLAFAVIRPRRLPEAVAAVPAAAIAIVLGLVTLPEAGDTIADLGPTLAFLAAVLVISHLADADGVFRWLGAVMTRRSGGDPQRLLVLGFVAAALTTAVLSLDATVVLLTPVVLATVRGLRVRPAPHLYATAHLSNTGSLLLPVSNLTNLLAFQASGLTFLGFTGLMTAPWLVGIGLEYLVFRIFFARQLSEPGTPGRSTAGRQPAAPLFSLVVLALVLVGFAVAHALGVEPFVVAVLGAVVLAARALLRGLVDPLRLLGEANVPFLIFVAALGIVVDAATSHGLEAALASLLPTGTGLAALLAIAGIAAVLANLVNNLPATLVLLVALGPTPAAGAVLAMLIGVNIGPNLTYTGSLATLLWRRVITAKSHPPSLGRFTRLGLITVPLCLAGATLALWAALLIG